MAELRHCRLPSSSTMLPHCSKFERSFFWVSYKRYITIGLDEAIRLFRQTRDLFKFWSVLKKISEVRSAKEVYKSGDCWWSKSRNPYELYIYHSCSFDCQIPLLVLSFMFAVIPTLLLLRPSLLECGKLAAITQFQYRLGAPTPAPFVRGELFKFLYCLPFQELSCGQ